jgi:hypothetical protein
MAVGDISDTLHTACLNTGTGIFLTQFERTTPSCYWDSQIRVLNAVAHLPFVVLFIVTALQIDSSVNERYFIVQLIFCGSLVLT